MKGVLSRMTRMRYSREVTPSCAVTWTRRVSTPGGRLMGCEEAPEATMVPFTRMVVPGSADGVTAMLPWEVGTLSRYEKVPGWKGGSKMPAVMDREDSSASI